MNFNESSMYRMFKKTNAHDSLLCVTFSIHDVVVRPFFYYFNL